MRTTIPLSSQLAMELKPNSVDKSINDIKHHTIWPGKVNHGSITKKQYVSSEVWGILAQSSRHFSDDAWTGELKIELRSEKLSLLSFSEWRITSALTLKHRAHGFLMRTTHFSEYT